MKSLVMKSVYAGLGLLGTGKKSIEHVARDLAKKANISEKEGEKIARQLSRQTERAIGTLQKSLNSEVTRVVDAWHAATKSASKGKTAAKRKAAGKPKRRAARPAKRVSAR